MSLVATRVSKSFTRTLRDTNVFEALHETSLELTSGTVTEICGRSGSGKSTLLNIVAGLLHPTTGTVVLNGQDLYKLDDKTLSRLRGSSIGVIPQTHSTLGSLTVIENILLPLELCGRTDGEETAKELLSKLGIAQLADVMPTELSGGETRRVAIARALVCTPQVVLADEPTGDLDDQTTDVVLKLLRDVADEGAAVLLVTHEATANRYADTIVRMEAGYLRHL